MASGEPNPKAPFREEKRVAIVGRCWFRMGNSLKDSGKIPHNMFGHTRFRFTFSRARAFVSHQRTVAQMPASAAISFRAPIAAPLRARASARRVHARRAVVAALPQKGKTALTGVLRVPKSEEAKMDAMWESHEKYMRDTHVIAGGPETTDEKPRVLEYYVSKAVELTDPTDAGASARGHPATSFTSPDAASRTCLATSDNSRKYHFFGRDTHAANRNVRDGPFLHRPPLLPDRA